ncbi:MAG TPA: stage III sporulation protein AF [Bacillota bacterium]|nr:stage III sporulation protein AF [Bacillota bacterium]
MGFRAANSNEFVDYAREEPIIEFIQNWARGFIALVILMGLIELLLPPDALRNYVRMVLGLLVIVALVRPIIQEIPGLKSWEPTLKTASTTGIDQVIGTGKMIRERGIRAANNGIKDNIDLETALQQRLPTIPIRHIERAGRRVKITLPATTPLEAESQVIQTLGQLGWDKNAIEVIRDVR